MNSRQIYIPLALVVSIGTPWLCWRRRGTFIKAEQRCIKGRISLGHDQTEDQVGDFLDALDFARNRHQTPFLVERATTKHSSLRLISSALATLSLI